MARLDNKVAIISGGARGQGAAEAMLFAREGAKVCFGDILDEEGLRLEAKIRELGCEATYAHLDVTEEEDWRKLVELTESKYGRLDILVNNAGIIATQRIDETSVQEWNKLMDVNLTGVFLGTKQAIPALRRSGDGSIVNISSTAGIVGIGRSAAYNASKGAVRLFTKATAIQHAKGDNIRCNSVHPGPINTPFLQELLDNPERLQERLSRVPLGRLGTPEDIAFGVLFLASDEASYMTGSELVIDGGATAE